MVPLPSTYSKIAPPAISHSVSNKTATTNWNTRTPSGCEHGFPIVFGFGPPTCSRPIRITFLNAGFVGITDIAPDRVTAVPFVCTDDEFEFRTELRLGMRTDEGTRLRIAAAFWELLASEPDALATYADWIWLAGGHGPNASIVGYWGGEFHVRGQVPDKLWA